VRVWGVKCKGSVYAVPRESAHEESLCAEIFTIT